MSQEPQIPNPQVTAPQGASAETQPAGKPPVAEKEKITIEAPPTAKTEVTVSPNGNGGPPPVPPTRQQLILLGLYLILIFLLLSYLLLKLWVRRDNGDEIWLFWGLFRRQIQDEVRVLAAVAVAGGLGSFFHAAKSYSNYVGSQRFYAAWIWWYLLRPFTGMALATIFYLVLRGGMLTGQATSDQISIYGVTALGAMAGLFSDQAALKLKEVFDTLFKAQDNRAGKLEAGSVAGKQKPTITASDPSQVSKGKDADVTVTGTGFETASKATLAGKAVASTFKTATSLIVNLKATDIPAPGTFDLVVSNSVGASDAVKLKVV